MNMKDITRPIKHLLFGIILVVIASFVMITGVVLLAIMLKLILLWIFLFIIYYIYKFGHAMIIDLQEFMELIEKKKKEKEKADLEKNVESKDHL